MKRVLAWAIPVGLVLALVVGWVAARRQEDEDYWGNILDHMERYDAASGRDASEHAAEAAMAYLDSLSAQQLIIAGRQGSRELMRDYERDEWPRVGLALGWFYQEYPKKTGNPADIAPLLQEIANTERPAYWRWFLEDMLTGSWQREGRLSNEQRRELTGTLLSVLERKDEHPAVLAKAAEGIPLTLAALKENLPSEERVTEHREALRALIGFSQRYVKTVAGLISQPDSDADVFREALRGLVRVTELELADTGRARAALSEAAENYAAYPEELWPRLMRTAVKLRAEADFPRLLAEALNAAEEEDVVERLQAVRSVLGKTEGAATEDESRQPKAEPDEPAGCTAGDQQL
jgi:hypothetical protein